jgi:hypothetical protein
LALPERRILLRMANTLLKEWQQLYAQYTNLQNDFISLGKNIQNFGQMFGDVSNVSTPTNVTPIRRGRRASASVATHRRRKTA